MAPSIRAATPADLPAITALLLADADERRSVDPALWPLAADASARIETALGAGLAGFGGPARELWLLAEAEGRAVGVAHAMIVPVPPIYDVATPPGLLLDDCFTAPAAPPGTAEALLVAVEAALREAGVSSFVASCPAAGSWRALYEQNGYEPVTLYLAKAGFEARTLSPDVRPATPEDIPAVVGLSADHRRTLARLNPRFWPTHPEADSRFGLWMQYSLTLKDRDMVVAGAAGELHGYVIAQPVSPLHIPAAHEIGATGIIDDFYDLDFADASMLANGGTGAAALLSAAESAFARRGFVAALVVCPAAWASKVAFLEGQGYRTAKLWMLKRHA